MKPATWRNSLIVLALGIGISACSQTADLGVRRVTQPGVDVAALTTGPSLFRSAETPGPVWYREHLSSEAVCRPFLVVEDPTGTAADIYSDTRC